MQQRIQTPRWPVWLAYVAVIAIWSTTPLAIKWSVEGAGFLLAVTGRMTIGAVLSTLLVLLVCRRMSWSRRAAAGYAWSTLGLYGAMSLVHYSALHISSGLISVVAGTLPLISGMLGAWLLRERAIDGWRGLGIVLGIAGLALVFRDQLRVGPEALLGALAVVVSIVLFALSSIGIKRYAHDLSPLTVAAGGQLGALPLFLLSLWAAGTPVPTAVPTRSLAAIGYLGVMGSVVGFVLYYFILQRLTLATVALINLMTPLLSLWMGMHFNDETVTPWVLGGTGLVLVGLLSYGRGRG